MTTNAYITIRRSGADLEAAVLIGDADVEYVTKPLAHYRGYRWPIVEFMAELSLRYRLSLSTASRIQAPDNWDRAYSWKAA